MDTPAQPQDTVEVQDNTGRNFNEEVKVNHVITISKPSQVLLSKLIGELNGNVDSISKRARLLQVMNWSLYIIMMGFTLGIVADPDIMVGSFSITRLLGIGIACSSIVSKSSKMDVKINKRLKIVNILQALLRRATLLEINFVEDPSFITAVEKIWQEFDDVSKDLVLENTGALSERTPLVKRTKY